jgi:predicted dehydrogenase
MDKMVETVMIGVGGMARYHIRQMLKLTKNTHIAVMCEPSEKAYDESAKIFKDAGLEPPPNQPDLNWLLKEYTGKLDAAFIITPHAYHHDQTIACMEAGLDVLLEKPMVMNVGEARSLIRTRDRTGKLLVVAFPGSLSPQIRMAVRMLRSGQLGPLLTISGVVWQDWGPNTVGTWRQEPAISGGGFMFDTGAHLLNTTADLAGEDFTEVAAWLDNQGHPVETLAVVIGRLKSGAMVTLNGCGEAVPSCASDIRVFCKQAILYTGVWGEKLQIQYRGDLPVENIPVPPSLGVWEQFLAVQTGKIPNPCPPEVGLRMTRLWDAIKLSAAQNGMPVDCSKL